MLACHGEDGERSGFTYVLARVFNLESDKVGLRMYVDPIAAKGRGELDFTVETWNVKPR